MKIQLPRLATDSIKSYAQLAINIARRTHQDEITFDYDGMEISVFSNSYPDDIVRIFNLRKNYAELQGKLRTKELELV